MFKSIKLNDVAEIRLGLPFKKAINDAGDQGTCYLIQIKDISPDEAIDFHNLPRVIPETSPVQHFLSKDDILLRLRGPIFSAAIIDKNIDFLLLLIIRWQSFGVMNRRLFLIIYIGFSILQKVRTY
ncbi:hypothetical protein BANRA_02487 [Acinetobacter baumannii]|nr:hypothetical protein BANRA_02487 [Acinetobacter baumannii]